MTTDDLALFIANRRRHVRGAAPQEGDDEERKDYLDGPLGERDRATLYAGGAGVTFGPDHWVARLRQTRAPRGRRARGGASD